MSVIRIRHLPRFPVHLQAAPTKIHNPVVFDPGLSVLGRFAMPVVSKCCVRYFDYKQDVLRGRFVMIIVSTAATNHGYVRLGLRNFANVYRHLRPNMADLAECGLELIGG